MCTRAQSVLATFRHFGRHSGSNVDDEETKDESWRWAGNEAEDGARPVLAHLRSGTQNLFNHVELAAAAGKHRRDDGSPGQAGSW
jgi:hypothetical protein